MRYLFILLLSIPALANATWTVWTGAVEHVDITAPAGVSVQQGPFQDLLTKPLGNGGAAKVGRGRVMINGVGSAFNAVKTYSAQGIAKAAAAAMIGKGAPLIALSSIGLSYAFEELEGLRQPTKLVYPPNEEPSYTYQDVPNNIKYINNNYSGTCGSGTSSSWDSAKSKVQCHAAYNGTVISVTGPIYVGGSYPYQIKATMQGGTVYSFNHYLTTTNCSTLGSGWSFDQSKGSCKSPPSCPEGYTLGEQSQTCIGNPQFVPIDTPEMESEIEDALQQNPAAAPEVAEEAAEEGHPPEPAGDTGTTPLLDSGPDGVPAPIEGDKKTEVTHGIDPVTGHPTTTTKETQPTYTFEPVNDVQSDPNLPPLPSTLRTNWREDWNEETKDDVTGQTLSQRSGSVTVQAPESKQGSQDDEGTFSGVDPEDGFTAGKNKITEALSNLCGGNCNTVPTCQSGTCTPAERINTLKTRYSINMTAGGECPAFTVDLSGQGLGNHHVTGHCGLIESVRGSIATIATIMIAIAFVFVVLGA